MMEKSEIYDFWFDGWMFLTHFFQQWTDFTSIEYILHIYCTVGPPRKRRLRKIPLTRLCTQNLLIAIICCFFSTLYKIIFYKFCKAGSGSGFGSANKECGATALVLQYHCNSDTQALCDSLYLQKCYCLETWHYKMHQ